MRADGKRTKNVMPLYHVAAHFMTKRYDAMNMITLDIPLDPLRKYIHQKRREGITLSHMGLFISAYLRTLCEFPALNRFVVNKRIYSRNEISVQMVVLKAGDINQETMSKIYFDIEDTSFDVQNKINEYINENRSQSGKNATDGVLEKLLYVPGLLSGAVNVLRFLDRHGLLPMTLLDMSPFHGSLLISNLASIRTNHIYHHTYEFGTTSLALTMGNLRDIPKSKGSEIVLERCIPVGLVMDERIATGVYFAQAFRKFREYLSNPSLLETPPEKVTLDFENQYEKSKLRRQRLREKKLAKNAEK